ncbi:hypothetical protein NM688_g1751 [Phlebia brevispora]|uniref:Uncharacterized protein n=1 Tax=Phlebia brevispora TaxID=194682 RepID=A0ACC1TA72_9APHY|nr:hypothetical protein NM688_g1751 [Phlebia brevispora]
MSEAFRLVVVHAPLQSLPIQAIVLIISCAGSIVHWLIRRGRLEWRLLPHRILLDNTRHRNRESRATSVVMDIFITNIPSSTTPNELKIALANVLHGQDYTHHRETVLPMNLSVFIHRRKGRHPTRTGICTVPTVDIGNQFLGEFAGAYPRKRVVLGAITLRFQLSNKQPPNPQILEELRRMPYQDPRIQEEREQRTRQIRSRAVSLAAIQFGWECRDNVYSIEWEKDCLSSRCELTFDADRREFRINLYEDSQTRIMAIRASQVKWTSAGMDKSVRTYTPVLYMMLWYPPSFETQRPETTPGVDDSDFFSAELFAFIRSLNHTDVRQRWSFFEPSQASAGVVQYTSIALRLVCKGGDDPGVFRELCKDANTPVDDFLYPAERRELFAPSIRDQYLEWIKHLSFPVAFQVEAITLQRLVDLREMLRLRRRITHILQERGEAYTIAFLRHFAGQAKVSFWSEEGGDISTRTIDQLFVDCLREYSPRVEKRKRRHPDLEAFDCLHVTVTPTAIFLQGPYPERSNRVIRAYPGNHTSFLRVSFVDETDLHYRFDREIDGRSFIARRVGTILTEGLDIAERHFDFLAYSQSALKEHAVWFVKEFIGGDGQRVNARTIIEDLGTFRNLPQDPTLMRCPARYGARVSQAFTATDSSVAMEAEEVLITDDIKDVTGKWTFTDGVGTISEELALEIWKVLRKRRRGAGKAKSYPRAFQIRLMGSKGMLSVDHRLVGRVITLRPSMIKFEAPDSRNLEIARAFHKPGPFYLNRPFIMILENLGVPYEVFRELQDNAVEHAERSVRSLEHSARLLETYGLGASFRLTSVMLSLHKLGLGPLQGNNFWERMMAFAIHHALRELKHHARIPVPDAWNLVGVADIHGYLKENEVFACIVPTDGSGPIYLEGAVMVSRSPTIHPGDVQVVRGIGQPRPGSPFERESLRNTLVFSTQGARPLPSKLGGGDLDGDEYRVTMLRSLMPGRIYTPADYAAAPRKLLDRESRMQDVADFVTEYITSDTLGIIANTWLIIADQSTEGILDPACLMLSTLHSDAVDYPKSGQPVALDKIPKLKFRLRPDWSAPETVTDTSKYYKSERAIGRLFRAIKLPAIETARRAQQAQRRHLHDDASLEDILEAFHQPMQYEDDVMLLEVAQRVSEFIPVGGRDDDLVGELWELYTRYVSELRCICVDHTLTYARDAMLSEEEVVVGTIIAKCSQARRRRDMMAQMREQATALMDGVRYEISGEEGTLPERSLQRAWAAFRLADIKEDAFGARSFAWVALGEIFEAIRVIEETEGYN